MEITFCNQNIVFPFYTNYTRRSGQPNLEITADGRFAIALTDEMIVQNGITLLLNDGVEVGRDWLKHLDRVKIVSLSISSFKRLLFLLNIGTEDAKQIERIRKVENKRVSTSLHRKKLAQEAISNLEKEKSKLVLEKQQLIREIDYYKNT